MNGSRAQHFSLDQRFSDFSLYQNQWEAVNTQISNKFSGDVNVAGSGTLLWETLIMLQGHNS